MQSNAKIVLGVAAAAILAVGGYYFYDDISPGHAGHIGTDSVIASPYRGGLTDDQVAALKTETPPLANAKWNHEVCAIAYQAEAEIEQIRKKVAKKRAWAQNAAKNALAAGEPADRVNAAVQEVNADLDQQARTAVNALQNYARNVPKCGGIFYRPAVISVCGRPGVSVGNPFCGIVKGKTLPGVSLSDDRAQFAHAIAWNEMGQSDDKHIRYRFKPWVLIKQAPAAPDTLDTVATALNGSEDDALVLLNRARDADYDFVAHKFYRYAITGTDAIDPDGKRSDVQFGAWHLSIEMQRIKRELANAEQIAAVYAITKKSGITSNLGPVVQYPQLRLQMYLYDVLLRDDRIGLYVMNRNGERVKLSAPANVVAPDSLAPRMLSSYDSYQVHAVMTPSADDWALLRSSRADHLIAVVHMMREDGKLQFVELPVPLDDLNDMLDAFDGQQAKVRSILQTLRARYEDAAAKFASEKARADAMKRFAARETINQARTYVAQHPAAYNCQHLSVPSTHASKSELDRFNQAVETSNECVARWNRDANETIRQMTQMVSAVSSASQWVNGGASTAFLTDAIDQWKAKRREVKAEIETENEAVRARDAKVSAHNARVSAGARERSYSNRRSDDSEDRHDYAADFFESQRHPPPRLLPDIGMPPAPNGYISRGWN